MAVFFLPSTGLAQGEDCAREITELRADLATVTDDEAGVSFLLDQLDTAEEHCEDGRLGLYSAFSGPAKSYLEQASGKTEGREQGFPDLAYLVGTWCYAHESGERAIYEIGLDGEYKLRPAEFNWQAVKTGSANDIFNDMEIIDVSENSFRVEIRGTYQAVFERGRCDGS